jgi:hypothetical protein
MHAAPSEPVVRPCANTVQRLNEQLSAVGVVPTSLPAKLRDDLTALAGIANELDLVVVSENSMAAAWGCLSVEDMKASRLQVREQCVAKRKGGGARNTPRCSSLPPQCLRLAPARQHPSPPLDVQMMLSHKQAELDQLLSKARSSCEQLAGSMQAAQQRLSRADRQLSQQAMQYWPDMPAKLKKYRDQESKHRAELDASGVVPQIKHSQLVASHQRLEGFQRELQEKQAAIEVFQGLPPSQVRRQPASLLEIVYTRAPTDSAPLALCPSRCRRMRGCSCIRCRRL